MRTGFWSFVFAVICASCAFAQDSAPKKLLLMTQSKGFVHDVVKRKDGQPCAVEKIFQQLADKTRLFTVESSQDASILTPQKLKTVDIVVFYTTLDLPMKPEDLDAFVKNGGSFLGLHSATDTFHGNKIYLNLINGEFAEHPWTQEKTVTIKVLDPKSPMAAPWLDGGGMTFREEIYHQTNFDPSQVHVILGLDMAKTELKKPYFVPIAWCKEYGKGKVFYTSLGHRQDVWENPRYQDHLIAAIKWLEGLTPADATPNPQVSEHEDEIAKKLAPPAPPAPEKPATEPAKKAAADPKSLPKVPDGFAINVFVNAPDIKSPASITVSPDGKVFVGEDEYNTQPSREQGLARVKLCADTDGDGVADKITVFADKLNAPQGLTFVGNTLYVVHAPFLTAFRDTNNDGVADTREDLITGFGPVPEGLVHHVPSGVRMGIDGWLYISIGDKGIVKATGRDGRTISLWGGGTVRVRPDGTMLEVFSHRTRNTFDVAIDPYLDAFTRDNTNDGDGWDSRVTQMQRDAEYGYPVLFKHFGDEIVQPLASYGSGSATGTLYVQEPSWKGTLGDCLYACDWARGILYRHELTRKGATFDIKQEEFIKDVRPTDLDMDGNGKMYVADWGRRDWGNAPPVGMVYRVATTQPAGGATTVEPYPADMSKADETQLLAWLASPRAVWRINAQCELLKRRDTPGLAAALTNMAIRKDFELYVRVAALFTLKQLEGEDSNDKLATLAALPELREFALRALADRDDQLHGVNRDLFTRGLTDPNPRVRVQAAIGLSHLGHPELAAALVPLTADPDPMVRHAAMQSLRRLNARDVCIAAVRKWEGEAPAEPLSRAAAQPARQEPRPPTTAPADIIAGAMRTLRPFHDLETVDAIASVYNSASDAKLRQEAIKAFARLYHVESKWDGKWWTPHPDTRGPYYVSAPWALTDRVAGLLIAATADRDVETAKTALEYIGLIEVKEATTTLTRLIAGGGGLKDDAAKALIALKQSTPEALDALERVVIGANFNADVRASAAQALAALDFAKSAPILIRIVSRFDSAATLPAGLLEKVCDSLSSHAIAANQVTALAPLLSASKESVRVAAATSMLRSTEAAVRDQFKAALLCGDSARVEAALTAVTKLTPDNSQPFTDSIHALLKDKDASVRMAATLALGHIGDASAVKDLVRLAQRDRNPLPAVSALAGIDPARTADDQVLLIATLLVDTSGKVAKTDDQAAYARLVSAAQKFLGDPRVPTTQASSLRSKLMEPGVIYSYLRTDPLPVPEGPAATYTKVFPPELKPDGPFLPFSDAKGKEITWKKLAVTDPKGMQVLTDMPDNSVEYLTTTIESANGGSAYLTSASDDGLHIWLNGKLIAEKNLDRGMLPDMDQQMISLKKGTNTLLFKVNNKGGAAGIQARLRTRIIEFNPDEALAVAQKARKKDGKRGRELFEQIGCVKCHTTDKHEEPKGPFLGDVGSKFDAKYIVESVMRPSAKIAQGFSTERIITKDNADYTGFVTHETADEVQLRDPSGKVTAVAKGQIKKRTTLAGSMMPEGLIDNLGIDDFGSLLAYLQSMK